MPEVTHSPFLQALGYAIINSLWQFALLWLIYVSINTLFKLSSHHKYSVGLLLQFTGFIWFTITFSFYFTQFSRFDIYSLIQQNSLPIANAATVRENLFIWIMQSEKLLPYLSISYLAFLIFLCCKWIRAYNYTQAIKTKGLYRIEATWRIFVKQLSTQLGIKREVKIYLSEMVRTPLTIGFFKPLILLPLASINHLNTHQMEAVIMHELAHIRRYDYLFNLFLALVEVTLFFNPFMLLISRHIKRERENCCDDWVLQYQYNATSYACALLKIATSHASSPVLAMKAAEDKHVLLNRIKRMIEKKDKTFNYRYQLMAFFVMLTVAGSLALLSSWHNINKASVSASRQVIVKPMAEIVNSPLYNSDFFIAADEEKDINDNKFSTEKSTNKNFSFDTSIAKRITSVTDNETTKQKHYSQRLSIEKKPPVPDIPEDPAVPDTPDDPAGFDPVENLVADHLEKNIEILNTGSNKVVIPVDGGKEHEIVLAEEQLKQRVIHLFEQNKAAIDQKQFMAEMKAAIEQIKAVTIKLELAKQKIGVEGKKRDNVREDRLIVVQRLASCNIDNLRRITKELQLQTEQAARVSELNSIYNNNNNFIVPNIIYHLPAAEKPHSFSFEFSTKPKGKVVKPLPLYNLKRGKKINKTSIKEDGKIFETENASPVFLNKLAEKDNAGVDNFTIIRI